MLWQLEISDSLYTIDIMRIMRRSALSPNGDNENKNVRMGRQDQNTSHLQREGAIRIYLCGKAVEVIFRCG